MPDYNKAAASALALLKRNGKALPIARKTRVINRETGVEESTTEQSGEITAVVLPARKGSMGFDDLLKKDYVISRMRYIIGAARGAPFKPESLDVLTFDGSEWETIGSRELSPAGIPVIYYLAVYQK